MKTKLTVSTDGINEEIFDDVKCLNSEKDIEKYAESALSSIAEIMLNLRIKVPQESLSLMLKYYGDCCRTEWQDSIKRLYDDISFQKEDYLIDDVIALLRDSKNNVSHEHNSHYNELKSIVLKHCRMDDPSVL